MAIEAMRAVPARVPRRPDPPPHRTAGTHRPPRRAGRRRSPL